MPEPAGGSGDTALNRRDNSPCPYAALMLALTSPVHLEMGQRAQAGVYYLARYMVVCHRYLLFIGPGQEHV